jgi:cysteine synthase B
MAVAQAPTEDKNLPRTPLGDRVGNTPLIPLTRLPKSLPSAVRILAKAEWLGPGGSVKDRPALAIIQSALQSGALGHRKQLLDSTSGNMGIAYATLAPAFGVRVHLAVPSNAGRARLEILRALGAELTLTDPLEGSDGARQVAAAMAAAETRRFFYADQYANPANWQAHFRTTGPEIVAQTQGSVTHLVCGLGTTGTLTGTGRYLRRHAPHVQLMAVQPDGPMHGIEGLKHLPTSLIPPIFDSSLPDKILPVTTESAFAMTRRLAREEGLLVGVSAGAAMAAALQVAETLDRGVVVVILPDSGVKYLDEPFWSQA